MNRSLNKQTGSTLIMHPAPLSFTHLYAQIEKASNKEMATAITQAFEQLEVNQKEVLVQNKQETLKEINIQDLSTKTDLENLRLATKTDIANLRLATKSDIDKLRSETKSDIENLRLATKADLVEQKLDLHKEISLAKWQVLGAMVALLFTQTVAKHFGFF